MKTPLKGSVLSRKGFTLIELLVVISIIGILAAMLLPALAIAKKRAQVKKAQLEIGQIVNAIREYDAAYNRFPISSNAITSAVKTGGDFTCGTVGVTCRAGGATNIGAFVTPGGGSLAVGNVGTYRVNNSEVMAILLDWETYPNGQATVNKGHVKNPQGTKFLNAVMVSGPTALNPNAVSPGIGSDGVYRDPWSNPYIISFDLNYDDKCRDDFYSGKVSIDPSPGANPNGGLNGLVKSADGLYYEANSPVMVWSAGPDQMIDPSPSSAKTGVNKDNVLSWKQ